MPSLTFGDGLKLEGKTGSPKKGLGLYVPSQIGSAMVISRFRLFQALYRHQADPARLGVLPIWIRGLGLLGGAR